MLVLFPLSNVIVDNYFVADLYFLKFTQGSVASLYQAVIAMTPVPPNGACQNGREHNIFPLLALLRPYENAIIELNCFLIESFRITYDLCNKLYGIR